MATIAQRPTPRTRPPSAGGIGSTNGWIQVGGTSLSCPMWAALVSIVDQGRAIFSLAGDSKVRLGKLPAGVSLSSISATWVRMIEGKW